MTKLFRNPKSFMSGIDPYISLKPVDGPDGVVNSKIRFERHHEGLIGIPHGGVAMGLCLDVWRNLEGSTYPVNVSFRFAGSGIAIGDDAILEVETPVEGAPAVKVVKITKLGDRKPYLKATFSSAGNVAADLPDILPQAGYRPLPYYLNCIVCGHSRSVIGLERQFRFHEAEGRKMVTVVWGDRDEDFDRAKFFLIEDSELHPFVLISIFDENTAWGSFMENKLGGLSVKLDFYLKRPVRSDEEILFIGRPAGIRGAPASPRFFHATGEILSMANPNNPEVVASGWGEWVVLSQYTEQIKKNLIPKSDLEWIFS